MRFIYHHDDVIHHDGKALTYAEFKELYPDFPLVEGQYFQYENEEFNLINPENGFNIIQKPEDFQNIIDAIGKL